MARTHKTHPQWHWFENPPRPGAPQVLGQGCQRRTGTRGGCADLEQV